MCINCSTRSPSCSSHTNYKTQHTLKRKCLITIQLIINHFFFFSKSLSLSLSIAKNGSLQDSLAIRCLRPLDVRFAIRPNLSSQVIIYIIGKKNLYINLFVKIYFLFCDNVIDHDHDRQINLYIFVYFFFG